MNRAPIGRIAGWILLLSLLLAGAAESAEIQARASRDPLVTGESFSLIFSSAENPDGDPDFSPLKRDFEILDQNKSNHFQFINGHKSHSITWTLELLPRKAGEIPIPAIAFGKDRSTPLTLKILSAPPPAREQAGRDDSDLRLEAEWSGKSVHLQEQILLTLRFLNAAPIAGASLQEPKVESGEALIEKLGEDQAYETTRDQRRFIVTERRYALFPQKSGTLTIGAIPLTAQLPGADRSGSLLREFFNDPFIKNFPLGPGRAGKTVRLSTEPARIEVKPVPTGWGGGTWLPVHRLELSENWSPEPPRFQVGEPVTRTLTLQADGATAAQLPELTIAVPPGIKSYPDKPRLEDQRLVTGIIGKSVNKIALIPATPGAFTLPAIEIPWWNSDAGRIETARLPERRITVLPAATTRPDGNASQPHPVPSVSSPAAPGPASEKPASAAPGPASEKPASAAPGPASEKPASAAPGPASEKTGPAIPAATVTTPAPFWPWLAFVLGCGWLGTAGAWWYRARMTRRNAPATPPPRSTSDPLTEPLDALKRACAANDPKAAHTALLRSGMAHAQILAEEVARLQAALYSPDPIPWHGESLWRATRAALNQPRSARNRAEPDPLPPLYPR
ncbi:BatD family protein [Candidatus Magnetaquiglobus chichijimensis]